MIRLEKVLGEKCQTIAKTKRIQPDIVYEIKQEIRIQKERKKQNERKLICDSMYMGNRLEEVDAH